MEALPVRDGVRFIESARELVAVEEIEARSGCEGFVESECVPD